MARQNLTEEKKGTITTMAAQGHTINEIAEAIGKWPSTVSAYVTTHQIQIKEAKGLLPDGTPIATREARPHTTAPSTAPATDEPDKPTAEVVSKLAEVVQDAKTEAEKDEDLTPRREWVQTRAREIRRVTMSRMLAMHMVPLEWIGEYNMIAQELKEENDGVQVQARAR